MKAVIPVVITSVVLSTVAEAHPGIGHAGGLGAAMAHPVAGIDHLLAALAVGLWAGRGRSGVRWELPAVFLGFAVIGILLAGAGLVAMPAPGIALAAIAAGLAAAFATRPAGAASLLLVAAVAMAHGAAHGAVIVGAAQVAGLAAVTALLLAVGIATGRMLSPRPLLGAFAGLLLAALGGGALT